jgi:DNA-binding LacI/PurR family transcriptional regulator
MPNEWPGMVWLQRGAEEILSRLQPDVPPKDRVHVFSPAVNYNSRVARATREYIRRLPRSTGILCTNIGMASDILGLAREVGVRCPEDIGVIGVPSMDYFVPLAGIDTVEFDWTAYLLDALHRVMQPEWPAIREWVKPSLVCRGSTGRASRQENSRCSLKAGRGNGVAGTAADSPRRRL